MAQRQRTAFIFVIFLAIYSKLKWFYFVQLRLNLVSIAHTIHIFKNFTYAFFVCLCAMCMRCASHTRSCLILPLRVCEIHLISLDVADRRHRRRLRPRLCVWVICRYICCVRVLGKCCVEYVLRNAVRAWFVYLHGAAAGFDNTQILFFFFWQICPSVGQHYAVDANPKSRTHDCTI